MEASERQDWWGHHRRNYNLWLIGAGLLAFACYYSVVWTRCPEIDTYEITLFTIAFQAVGYLLAMAIANVCYFLGPISEKLVQPQNPAPYRRFIFGIGVIISVSLPFLVPIAAYINVPRCH